MIFFSKPIQKRKKEGFAMDEKMTTEQHERLTYLMTMRGTLTPDEIDECDRLFGLWDSKNLYLEIHGELYDRDFSNNARKNICFSIGSIF